MCSTYLIRALQAARARYFGTVDDAASAGHSSALNLSMSIAPAVSLKYLRAMYEHFSSAWTLIQEQILHRIQELLSTRIQARDGAKGSGEAERVGE
jgi:hypothetical protein